MFVVEIIGDATAGMRVAVTLPTTQVVFCSRDTWSKIYTYIYIYCVYLFLFSLCFWRVCSEDVISVWNRSASNTEGIEKMRDTLKRLLKIPPFVQVYIHTYIHDPCK